MQLRISPKKIADVGKIRQCAYYLRRHIFLRRGLRQPHAGRKLVGLLAFHEVLEGHRHGDIIGRRPAQVSRDKS